MPFHRVRARTPMNTNIPNVKKIQTRGGACAIRNMKDRSMNVSATSKVIHLSIVEAVISATECMPHTLLLQGPQ